MIGALEQYSPVMVYIGPAPYLCLPVGQLTHQLFPVWSLHTDLLQLMGLKKQGLRNGHSRIDLVLM